MSTGTINKVILIGHTGDTVKMHRFEGGGCIGRVSLATNETYTKKDTGEKVSSTEWHSLIFRNKGAEIVEKYLDKGAKVYIEGKLKTRKWQDEKGQDRYSTEIEVRDFTFLSSKGESQSGGSTQQSSSREQHGGDQFLQGNTDRPGAPAGFNQEEDDLPF